jgi:hypothetical protein
LSHPLRGELPIPAEARSPIFFAMDTDRSIVVHGPVKGICTECGAPLKWAERSLAPENRTAAQVFIVCKNNHRLLDVFAISTLAASLFS